MENTLRSQEKVSVLNQIPLFAGLSSEDKKFVASISSILESRKGDHFYRQGDSPDALYCIVTGRVLIYLSQAGAREELEYLKRGKYFGILSLLTGEPHSVSAQAVNDSIILKISRTGFNEMLSRIPSLAIHFGEMLSKRLKRKDSPRSKVFESMIIGIAALSENVGCSRYAYNLALSIVSQTGKKAIIVGVGSKGGELTGLAGRDKDERSIELTSPIVSEKEVSSSIFSAAKGVDLLAIRNDPGDVRLISPLLSYLTADYHYVLADIPFAFEEPVIELLNQCDMVQLLSVSDTSDLGLAGRAIERLKTSRQNAVNNIKVVAAEYGSARPIDFASKRAAARHDIFATLPDIRDIKSAQLVAEHPELEYSRAIRRIARDIGGCQIGLALGSGAAMGLAHIGVLRVLEREMIPVDILAGTSMGALIGALWASGKNTDEISRIVFEFRSKIRTLRLMDLAIPKRGLIKGREVRRFLYRQFGDMTFYNLKLPFRAVCCDIEKREEVVVESGSLVDAVMASISIPGVFEPVTVNGRLLVDGGIINPLPTNVLMRLDIAKIISVNTLPSPQDIQRSKKKVTNIFDIIVNSVQASEYLLAEASAQDVDVSMHPVLPTVDWYEFYEAAEVIKRGEEEAMSFIGKLRELAAST